MDKVKNPNSFTKHLTEQQKWSLVLLVVVAITIFFIWFFNFKSSIITPMYGGLTPAEVQQISDNKIADEEFDAFLEELDRTMDTDGDGLFDYDELNIYYTSPYLPDSDSDGILDEQEIIRGTDPNCPEGKDCYTDSGLMESDNDSQNDSLEILQQLSEGDIQSALESGLSSEELLLMSEEDLSAMIDVVSTVSDSTTSLETPNPLEGVFGENPGADEIREILLSSGVTQKELDKYTDDELLQTFSELIE